MKAADYDGFPARKAEAEKRGKKRGIGMSCYIEACGIAPSQAVGSLGAGVGLWESAEVRVNAVGTIEVLTGSHSHGQGHETTFAQLVAERFGVPIDSVSIVHGDTDKVQMGMGTYGSRSGAVGMSAIFKALDKVEAKAKKIAAHQLEADENDIVIENGELKVAGTDKTLPWFQMALAAYTAHNLPEGMEPGLKETAFYDPTNFTFPAGCYICEVEVDPDTGQTEIVQFVAADDFGKIINPMIVEGQVHGGLAQGIGQALLEGCSYDDAGQLVTASYMDYCMPRADDLPSFKVSTTETACPGNPLGMKGCGEAGAIGSPPAVINAITDAIGTNDLKMPATPQTVWAALHRHWTAVSGHPTVLRRERQDNVRNHLSPRFLGRRGGQPARRQRRGEGPRGRADAAADDEAAARRPDPTSSTSGTSGAEGHQRLGPLGEDRRSDDPCRGQRARASSPRSVRRSPSLPA